VRGAAGGFDAVAAALTWLMRLTRPMRLKDKGEAAARRELMESRDHAAG